MSHGSGCMAAAHSCALGCGSEAVTASAAEKLPMFKSCKFGHCKLHAWPKHDVHAEVRFQQLHVTWPTCQESNFHCSCVSQMSIANESGE